MSFTKMTINEAAILNAGEGKIMSLLKWKTSNLIERSLEGNGNLEYSLQKRLAGYSSWGHKRAGHDLATKQQQTRQFSRLEAPEGPNM